MVMAAAMMSTGFGRLSPPLAQIRRTLVRLRLAPLLIVTALSVAASSSYFSFVPLFSSSM